MRDLDSGRDAVHRLLEDVHDARDDDQRAHRARLGADGAGRRRKAVAKHFVAVSTNAAKVAEFGIDTANMFGFWDWVGGRYSMDSAIGLSTMIADRPGRLPRHARRLPRDGRALPHRAVRAEPAGAAWACSRVWYSDFFGAQTVAVLPYDQYLKRFPAYLQQLDDGEQRQARRRSTARRVDYDTGPIYWGEPGTNGQHSFYQLIHQGTRLIPCDFIAFAEALESARAATTTC